jgi:uncharacterized repeat protein (TIGR01451 family)
MARRAARNPLALLLSLVLALAVLLVGPGALTTAAAAAGDFACGNNVIYGTIASGAVTNLHRIDASTGTSTVLGTFPGSVNALAISKDGDAAYAITNPATAAGQASFYKYGTTGVYKTLTGLTSGAGIPAGGFNAATNDYWFATVDSANNLFQFYRVDLDSAATTVAFASPTMTYTASGISGASVGTDLTFDSQGRLYLVVSTNSTSYTNKTVTFSPAQLSAGGSQPGNTLVNLDAGSATTTFPGVAFGSSGHLYTQGGSTLYQSNPTNGAQTGTTTTSAAFTDLASCANPTIINAVRKNVIDRKNSGDRFTLSLSGSGFTSPSTAVAATPATGVQNEQVAPAVVLPNTTYNIAETAANGANLADYISTWQCVNDDTDAVIASGSGASGSFTTPNTIATGQGVPIVCTFRNEVKSPRIEITKNASGNPTKAGDHITYSFTVTNTGNRPLTGVTVTDPLLGAATITCAGTSLAAGASTTCTASADYVVTQANVEAGSVVNTATVVATPPTGEGAAGSVSDTDGKTVTIDRTPRLKLVKTASGSPFAVGDQITYGFTVTNTGNVQVTSVGVSDPRLSGVTCAVTTLAPGDSTTCSAPAYSVAAADVAAHAVTNTATPSGSSTAGAAAVDPTSTTSVTTPLGTLPTASADTKSTRQNVPTSVNPLANDTAGASGSGAAATLVPGSVVFTSPSATDGGRTLVVAGQGTWTIDAATGVVTFTPEPAFTGTTVPAAYRVTDSLGHSADSTVTITVDPIVPDAVDDSATTGYLTPVTVSVLGNDAAGAVSAPLVPGSVVLTSPAATNGGRTLAVPGQGTWTIDAATGAVTFTPVAGFTGAATPVEYRVADTNGTTDLATVTVTVTPPPAPAASPDTATTLQNVDVQLDPVGNDSAFGGATLDPGSVVFTSAAATDGGRRLVVAGEGTWTIDPATGRTTFDPEPGFSGATTPVTYRVADNLGRTATSTLRVTVIPVTPTAADDAALTPYLTPVELPALANDAAGNAGAPLVPGSLVFTDAAATDGGHTLVTAQGTWTVLADSTVRFVPAAGFSGPTESVAYRIADTNGTTATAHLVVTVGTPPTATPDTGTTPQNTDIIVEPLLNDAAGSTGPTAGTLMPGSLRFTSAAATAGGTRLVVPGEGNWTVDVLSGLVTFDPEPAFTGATTPVAYEVTDTFGNPVSSTITITVTPIVPAAVDDVRATPFNTPVSTLVLANDTAGDVAAPLVTSSVVFTSPDATDGGTRLVVAGEGAYSVDGSGLVTFTPQAGFSGAATPVAYRVADTNGTTATASLSITVGAPPVANPDVDATPQNVNVTVGLVGNDVAGTDGAGYSGSLDAASVAFTDPAATNGGRTLVVPGEGTYTIDAATGAATFDPEPAFTGAATPVGYRVTDSFGHVATSTLTITVTPVVPAATDDVDHTRHGTPVTTDVLGNDTEGAASSPLQPGSVVITTPGATDGGRTLVVAGQGTWTVRPDGSIRFAPEDGFAGPATIAYQVSDANGTPATANLVVTVGAAPMALDDAATTPQNVTVVLEPLANDTTGDDGDGTVGALDPASLVFTSPGATDGGRTLVVDGEGTWTIDPATGRVSFDPEPQFTGPATPVAYEVTDSLGQTTGAELAVTVTPVVPVAANDSSSTAYRTPVTVGLLGNDTAGAASAPLDPASVVFTSAAATDAGKTLVVPGQGTYHIGADGAATFTPATGFTGTAGAVGYRVADANGSTTTATLTVTVAAPPAPSVVDDTAHTPYLTPVTAVVLGNDTAGGLATLQPASVRFTDPAAVNGGHTLVVAGEGTYQVNPDGSVAFTPVAGFSGPASAVAYEVSDELGQTGSARLVVTVGEPPAATDDAATTPQNVPVTLDPLANDAAGDDGAGTAGGLRATSVVFASASATDGGRTLMVPGEGTWTIDPVSGAATFTPEPAFTGATTPVAYRVTDSFGNPAAADLVVTVTPITPTALDDAATTPFRTPVGLAVLGNDTAGAVSAPLVPASVVFPSAAATDGGHTLVVPGEGTWRVLADGSLTFTPADDFSGPASPVAYRVSDANGTSTTAQAAVIVGAPPAAVADAAATPYDVAVTLHPLGNDTAGDDGAGHVGTLTSGSLRFTSTDATDGGHTLVVAGQGTWVIDPATAAVAFDPEPGFTGPAASVQYRVADSFGNEARALLAVTVGEPPAATDDATTTPQNVTVTIDPLANDLAGGDGAGTRGALVPGSVVFTSAAATDGGRTVVVAGEGSWTIDPVSGAATFDPEPAFTGVATPVTYEVTDEYGNPARARLRVTVVGIEPVAADDTAATPAATPVVVPVLGNDTAGAASAPLVPGSVVFTSPDATDGGRTLVVAGEGTWVVNPDGTVTFTPEDDFSGPATPVRYAVRDGNGTTASAQVSVLVGEPPAAAHDTATTPQNVTVTIDPLGNDTAGDDGAGHVGTLDPASVRFTSPDATDGGRTLVVDGEGTWTIDPATGAITFDPEPAFTGTTEPAAYRVTDSFGNRAGAHASVVVTPITPVAVNDAGHTPFATPVTLAVLGNDTAGAASAPLDPASVVFTSADATDGGRTLVVAGEGTWVVNPDGTVTFTPEDGFSGTATPVQYRVSDTNGTPVAARLAVTVGALPAASDDTGRTPQNVTITVCAPCNDTAGDDGAGHVGTLDPASVRFISPDATDGDRTLVVDGEGTWTIDPATGAVTFDPETAFTGAAAPVDYRVTDSFGNTVSATIRITVDPVAPVPAADRATGAFNTPVTIPILGNDLPGDDSAPLVPGSVVFTSPDATDGGKTLVVDGEGTWRVNPDGTVTFTPVDGYTGTTTPVAYAVTDTNGEVATSTVAAVIGAGPAASDDQVIGEPGQPVVIDVLGNDSGGSGCELQPASLVLLSGDPLAPTTVLDVPGEGVWTANAEGTLVFTPADGFSGWTTWVTYEITDSCGNPVTSQARAFAAAGPVDDMTDEDSGSLAYTGAAVGGVLGLGLVLLVAGGVLLAVRRRREA